MVFKRGVALLVLAAAAAVATTEASAPITVKTDLKNPVVKDVSAKDGKVVLTLEEKPVHKKHAEHKKHVEHKKHADKKHEAKKPVVVKVAPKKDAHKKHPAEKKHEDKKHAKKHEDKKHAKKHEDKKHAKKHEDKKHAKKHEDKKHAKKHEDKKHTKKHEDKKHHKQVSEEKKPNGEVIRKYAHGSVRVMAKNQPKQPAHKKAEHKKEHKKVEHKKVEHKKPVKTVTKSETETVETTDLELKTDETVSVDYHGHEVSLTLLKNGSILLEADGEEHILPNGDVTLDVDDEGDDSDSSDSGSADADVGADADSGSSDDFLTTVEKDVSGVAQKFSEFATKLTGNGALKGAAPVIFIGAAVGALAAIVGIAAIAVGRARNNAAADPQSVLADATEDVEADVKAESTEEEDKKDEDAEDSQSLDSSDSESEDEKEQGEEGKFTNEVASV